MAFDPYPAALPASVDANCNGWKEYALPAPNYP